MVKTVAVVNYPRCLPEKCDHGICVAALECERGSLVQESPYQAPEINPSKWCNGCAKCVRACPMEAITMI